MNKLEKMQITEENKNELIDLLTNELETLRTKADISQNTLAELIGVSRQTYGDIERKKRRMTWNTYLSMILFFDYNKKTHQMIRDVGVFPYGLFGENNENNAIFSLEDAFDDKMKSVIGALDEQALSSIRTMIMIEFARCTGTPGEAVIKSFEGLSFAKAPDNGKIRASKALKAIKHGGSAYEDRKN